jgi:hypothetical protein
MKHSINYSAVIQSEGEEKYLQKHENTTLFGLINISGCYSDEF